MLAKVKKFLSLIVTVDPSSYILYVTGNILESPIQRSSVSFLCLDMPNQFQLWLIRFARVIRITMSILSCPVPQSAHQSAEDSQTSCHASLERTANPQDTKLLFRTRQHIGQTACCQSRRIYNACGITVGVRYTNVPWRTIGREFPVESIKAR